MLVVVAILLVPGDQGGIPLLAGPDTESGSTPFGSPDAGPPFAVVVDAGQYILPLDTESLGASRDPINPAPITADDLAPRSVIQIPATDLPDLDRDRGVTRSDASRVEVVIATVALGLMMLKASRSRDNVGRGEAAARLTERRDVQSSTPADSGAAVPA